MSYFLRLHAINTTFNNGSLGSRIDEERSEMRYVMWIAEFSESSNLWTHLAPFGIPRGTPVWVSWHSQNLLGFFDQEGFGLWRFLLAFLCWSQLLWNELVGSALPILDVIRYFYVLGLALFPASNRLIEDNWLSDCHLAHKPWPQIGWDYPLNLSISISGGKETNKDSPSNCEWSGKSSNLKSDGLWPSEL